MTLRDFGHSWHSLRRELERFLCLLVCVGVFLLPLYLAGYIAEWMRG